MGVDVAVDAGVDVTVGLGVDVSVTVGDGAAKEPLEGVWVGMLVDSGELKSVCVGMGVSVVTALTASVPGGALSQTKMPAPSSAARATQHPATASFRPVPPADFGASGDAGGVTWKLSASMPCRLVQSSRS